MDAKDSIDLPEPVRQTYSPEEKASRQWRLLVTFVLFVTIYAGLHKVVIPLFLKFTSLDGSLYSHIQYSFLASLALAVSMYGSACNNRWISFFCGVAIVLGIDEVYQTALSRHQGWFAFSRLLSSIPLAVAAGVAMSRRAFRGGLVYAWLGAISLLFYIGVREWKYQRIKMQIPVTSKYTDKPLTIVPLENPLCGAMALHVDSATAFSRGSVLEISSCGFTPSTLLPNPSGIRIKNETDSPVNVHLVFFEKGKRRIGWNLLVPSKQELTSPPIKLKEENIAVIYSDSHPNAGLVGLFYPTFKGSSKLTRKPLLGILEKEEGKSEF